MKVGDLVRIKGLARPENANIGVVVAMKAKGPAPAGRQPFVEATVAWNKPSPFRGTPERYWSHDLEVIG